MTSPLHVRFFGTYQASSHPRVRVLQEGFLALGDEVTECNVPLGLDTADRVRVLQRPWLGLLLAVRVLIAWARLSRKARRLPPPDVVVVGYLGHLDVRLARRIHPRVPLVLDHLVSLGDTALDRGARRGPLVSLLDRVDAAAVGTADLVVVDTEEHRRLLAPDARVRAVVVPVGAPARWFVASPAATARPLRVVFFGLFTPLQGTVVIGDALGSLAAEGLEVAVTLIGDGQDRAECRRRAAGAVGVRWLDWVDPGELPALVAAHDVCLGIFGTGPKARRVVPNKVFQGAAAGCAIVTSDTAPQRAALGTAARYVPAGDAGALAGALRALAADRDAVDRLRAAAHARAVTDFRSPTVVAPLRERLCG